MHIEMFDSPPDTHRKDIAALKRKSNDFSGSLYLFVRIEVQRLLPRSFHFSLFRLPASSTGDSFPALGSACFTRDFVI
jgi:hypothetical protein